MVKYTWSKWLFEAGFSNKIIIHSSNVCIYTSQDPAVLWCAFLQNVWRPRQLSLDVQLIVWADCTILCEQVALGLFYLRMVQPSH